MAKDARDDDEALVKYVAENSDLSPLQVRSLIRKVGRDRDALMREAKLFKAEG